MQVGQTCWTHLRKLSSCLVSWFCVALQFQRSFSWIFSHCWAVMPISIPCQTSFFSSQSFFVTIPITMDCGTHGVGLCEITLIKELSSHFDVPHVPIFHFELAPSPVPSAIVFLFHLTHRRTKGKKKRSFLLSKFSLTSFFVHFYLLYLIFFYNF